MGRTGKRLGRTAALLVVVATLITNSLTTAAAQEFDGLDVVSETVYRPQPEQSSVAVHSTFTITNEQPTVYYDTYYTEYYFDRFPVFVPIEARGLTATANGSTLGVTFEPLEETERMQVAIVSLPYSLFYGQSLTIDLDYVILGGAPRSETFTRVNPAFVALPLFVCCDPGQAALRVEIPASFDVELEGDDTQLEWRIDGDVVVYESAGIDDPEVFFAYLVGRDDDGLRHEDVDAGSTTVRVSAWRDDVAWLDFATEHVRSGVPVLERLIGLPWPEDRELEVVETVTPYLYGYAGWYDPTSELIEIGEDLDAQVMLHEFSHLWFNYDLFAERWIGEGLAEVFSYAALDELGGAPDGEIAEPDVPDLDDPAARPLNSWDTPLDATEDEVAASEDYGYNASWYVLDQLADEVGLDGLAAIIAAAEADELSYQGLDGVDTTSSLDTWRRFLDLAELRAGSTEVEDLLRTHVLTESDIEALDARAEARAAYDPLAEAAAPWSAPLGLREDMSRWRFGEVSPMVEAAEAVLDARAEVWVRADELDLDLPTEMEDLFESADRPKDLELAIAVAEEQHAAMDVVERATATATADHGFLTRFGLRGVDLDQELADVRAAVEDGRYDDAETQTAELERLVREAPDEAKAWFTRVGIAAGAGLVLLVAIVWMWRRRRRGTAPTAGSVPSAPGGAAPAQPAPS